MNVISFLEYIHFQLRGVTKQLTNMHNVLLCALSKINCVVHRCTEDCWTPSSSSEDYLYTSEKCHLQFMLYGKVQQ